LRLLGIDIRVENPRTDPVSIEVKWADRWTLADLLERLENQLIGQYLRDHNAKYGIYLLGMFGQKQRWAGQVAGTTLTFEEVLTIVTERAKDLAKSRPDVADISVVGIDFREPA